MSIKKRNLSGIYIDEYLYYKNGCWFTHDDYQLPDVCFLNEKEQGWWDDGWSVVS